MGTKIPSAEMRRGDVIFYGPGGSQHVTLYLGNNQMLKPLHRLDGEDFAGTHQRRHRSSFATSTDGVIPMSRNVSRRLRAVGTVLVAVGVAVGCTPANADPGLWDPTLPQILSAGAR